MNIYKINIAQKILYQALGGQTGLTDLEAVVYTPSMAEFTTVELSEIAPGLYSGDFTPDDVGRWLVVISSIASPENTNAQFYFVANVDKLPASIVNDGSIQRLAVNATIDLSGNTGDAFSRLRTAEPETIFDSKYIHDKSPLFWDEALESGSGITSTHSVNGADVTLESTLNTAGKFTRQTYQRFNYQPGKSSLILMTGTLISSGGGTDVITRIGYFDDDNGLFFEYDSGIIKTVVRTSISGSPVDIAVNQSNWNIDKLDGTGISGINIDWTKSQIFVIDFQWLGTGQIRFSLEANGIIHPIHTVFNTNIRAGVYMSTPNLPLRYQIITSSSSAASSMKCICQTVISEGGKQDLGVIRYSSLGSSNIKATSSGTVYAILGIRLKNTSISATIKILTISLLSTTSNDYEWQLIINPTLATSVTFNDQSNSAIQIAIGDLTAPTSLSTVTGGTVLTGGYVKSGSGAGALNGIISNALTLGASIAGVRDEIYLCVRPLSNNASIAGGIAWREIA
jgi:hypothetical protein